MARIVFPDSISGWIKLFRKVKPKVLALSTPNTIDSYMTENTVDLTVDETAVNAAETAASAAEEKENSAEKHTKTGQLLLNKCDKDHRKCVQNLKTIYRTNTRKLGDWGVTVDNESKVVYKTDAGEHAVEMQALITKHASYAAGTSPLQPLLDEEAIDLTQNSTDITAAIVEFNAADADHEASETQNADVTLKLTNVIEHLRGIGQAAVRMYASNPNKASDLGFNIDTSKQAAKLRTITLEISEKIKLTRLDVGSFVAVEGDGEVSITPTGPQATRRGGKGLANKNKKCLLTYGYGSCEIENLSSTSKVTITIYLHQ